MEWGRVNPSDLTEVNSCAQPPCQGQKKQEPTNKNEGRLSEQSQKKQVFKPQAPQRAGSLNQSPNDEIAPQARREGADSTLVRQGFATKHEGLYRHLKKKTLNAKEHTKFVTRLVLAPRKTKTKKGPASPAGPNSPRVTSSKPYRLTVLATRCTKPLRTSDPHK